MQTATCLAYRSHIAVRLGRLLDAETDAALARELRMKRTPQLTFAYDRSVEEGARMSKLIDELVHDE